MDASSPVRAPVSVLHVVRCPINRVRGRTCSHSEFLLLFACTPNDTNTLFWTAHSFPPAPQCGARLRLPSHAETHCFSQRTNAIIRLLPSRSSLACRARFKDGRLRHAAAPFRFVLPAHSQPVPHVHAGARPRSDLSFDFVAVSCDLSPRTLPRDCRGCGPSAPIAIHNGNSQQRHRRPVSVPTLTLSPKTSAGVEISPPGSGSTAFLPPSTACHRDRHRTVKPSSGTTPWYVSLPAGARGSRTLALGPRRHAQVRVSVTAHPTLLSF